MAPVVVGGEGGRPSRRFFFLDFMPCGIKILAIFPSWIIQLLRRILRSRANSRGAMAAALTRSHISKFLRTTCRAAKFGNC